MKEATLGEAVGAIAKERPAAAALMVDLMERSARERYALLYTLEQIREAEEDAYLCGVEVGAFHERERIKNRIFSEED